MIQTSFQVCNKLKPPHPTLDITLSGFSWMSALARNDITYDSTRAARDDLRVSNWAPFQSPTNAAVFTKGSALGGFGLCWKRFCYADMLLVVPLVISLVYLKVPDCSRCHVSTFSMKTYENKAYIFSIVEKQMLRWWLWHLGVGTSCIRLHIVAKGNSYWFCSSTNMFCMLKFYSFLWSKTPYLSPAVVFFCKRRPLVRNEAMHGATFGASKRWTSKCGRWFQV